MRKIHTLSSEQYIDRELHANQVGPSNITHSSTYLYRLNEATQEKPSIMMEEI